MHKEHEYLDIPPDDVVLWRYMDFTKFVSLLEKSALFFPRADKLGDPFEGYWPISADEEQLSSSDATILSNIHRAQIALSLISCWHESSHESEAMWKLYSRETDGVAIRTDFGSLMDSFGTNYPWMPGRVKYIDYDETSLPATGDFWRQFLQKRKSFQHEREVRIIIQERRCTIPLDFSPVYDAGNYYEVDLSILIHKVVVAPYAQDWLVDLVQSVAARYHLKAPVNKSKLGDPPTWFS